jgi:glycosyltransferase involved in cell wall biosynthesis
MPELVSILIPSYNAEKWIRETIESALFQTWGHKEIIIVDDGSTDSTLQIVKQYESNLVKVISQENRGANAARNRALVFAQGDYLQWLDADDLLAPDKIEKQMVERDRIGNPRILLTSSWGKFYYRYQNAKFSPDNLWRDLDPIEWLVTRFRDGVWMNPAAWLVSRKLTELAGPWDQRLVRDQDGEYICRVVSQSENVKFVPEARSYYRQGNLKSLSRDLSEKARESGFLAGNLCIGYLRSLEDSERTRAACLMNLQRCLYYVDLDQTAILEKANALAKELGGELQPPTRSWKYSIIEQVLGSKEARRAQRWIATFKMLICRNWHKVF